jgi:mRNA deadenylase 3'-5' endonuclease subunit Ccr4
VKAGKKAPQALKIVHWNILAQRLCDAFDLIDDNAPMLKFDNRLRLIKEHIVNVDADIVAMSEIDTLGGKHAKDLEKLVQMMTELGYCCQTYDKSNNMSGSGIFYKEDKYMVEETK